MDKPVWLTKEVYNNLIDEFNSMKETVQKNVVEKLEKVRSMDLSITENEEYEKVKEELILLEARIARYEEILNNAVIIDEDNENNHPDTDIIVTFSKEIEILLKMITEREKEEERILSEAYDWAFERQRELGFLAQPVHMTFSRGDLIDDGDGFTLSLFYKKSTGEALLRRDWETRMAVSFNILTNYDEIEKIAPKSLKKMLQNGLRLKQRWEEEHEYYD